MRSRDKAQCYQLLNLPEIVYTLVRSNRKTLAIQIRDGQVTARAPLDMPLSEIEAFITLKAALIRERLADTQQRATQRDAFRVGDTLRYRGKAIPLEAREGERAGFDEKVFFMPPHLEPQQIKAVAVQLYRLLAKRHLSGRVAAYCGAMGASPTAVKINNAKTRWGSCSQKGSLNFAWRLIMAEDDIIDYVVVHELAHLHEMNHSARFWALVAAILPDYRARRERLAAFERQISVENWDL